MPVSATFTVHENPLGQAAATLPAVELHVSKGVGGAAIQSAVEKLSAIVAKNGSAETRMVVPAQLLLLRSKVAKRTCGVVGSISYRRGSGACKGGG